METRLMRDFAKVYKEYQLIDDAEGIEILFRDFFVGEDRETLLRRNWNNFKWTCRDLVNLDCYSIIVLFMYGVFLKGKKYNLEMIKSKLEKITLPNGNNLAVFCKDFFLLSMQDNLLMIDYEEDIPEDLDVYNGSAEEYSFMSSYIPGNLRLSLSEFIAKSIYGIDIDAKHISEADVDLLVKKAIEMKIKENEKENEYIRIQNLETEEIEKKAKGKIRLPRLVSKKLTEFDKRVIIPGALLDLFKAAEFTNQVDICYYILTKYVWPTFSIVPWKQKHKLEVRYMGILLRSYSDYIYDLMMSENYNLRIKYILKNDNDFYNDSDFYKELIGNIDGTLLKPGKELYSKYPELGLAMAKTLSMGKEIIRSIMPNYLYSFLMAFTPYVLYCCDYKEEAAGFLINNFDEINNDDKRNLYVQLILVRSILSSTTLEKASTLYGYFNYEMDRQARERSPIIDFIEEIIQYIRDVKEYLESRNESTLDTNKLWVDVVFGDGKIMKDVELAKSSIDNNEVPSELLFTTLMRYVEAFSYRSGIRLKLLGLPNEDNYDKLPDALSEDLIKQGEGLIGKMDEYLNYYQSINLFDIRKNVNVFLQQHISNLMDETVNESIKAINNLRLQFLGESIECERQEFVTEQMISEIDEVVNRLSNRLKNQYIGRTEIEMYIANLQKEFIRNYRIHVPNNNLITMLPAEIQQDCVNYVSTSEIVFRMLSNRNDKEQLDFSPALIPLTKVLELLLNYVFKKMNIIEYPEMDDKINNKGVRSYYFDSNGRKKVSIEFGPCIYLLCDGQIRVSKHNGNIELSWHKEYINGSSRFDYWGGNNVLDIEKLKYFAGLNIKFDNSRRNPDGTFTKVIENASFANDGNFNRMLLVKGLEFVKNNFRNIVAHKDGVSLQTVEECRDILLQSESLLWILIYILK